jgi:hypothetical protein
VWAVVGLTAASVNIIVLECDAMLPGRKLAPTDSIFSVEHKMTRENLTFSPEYRIYSHVRWVSLSGQHGASSGCGWSVAADKRQGVDLQFGVWRGANNPSPSKASVLRKGSMSLGPGRVFWIKDLSEGIWT